jgi:hypothetical protein
MTSSSRGPTRATDLAKEAPLTAAWESGCRAAFSSKRPRASPLLAGIRCTDRPEVAGEIRALRIYSLEEEARPLLWAFAFGRRRSVVWRGCPRREPCSSRGYPDVLEDRSAHPKEAARASQPQEGRTRIAKPLHQARRLFLFRLSQPRLHSPTTRITKVFGSAGGRGWGRSAVGGGGGPN